MTKVVIDTNVVVSANLVEQGPSAAILLLATDRKLIQMCISPIVLAEYEEVLRRPRLKFSTVKIENTLALIRSIGYLVHPTTTLKISPDDSDNRLYECAEAAKADYLITGNTADFPKDHGTTKIITPRNFLDRVVPLLLRGEF